MLTERERKVLAMCAPRVTFQPIRKGDPGIAAAVNLERRGLLTLVYASESIDVWEITPAGFEALHEKQSRARR